MVELFQLSRDFVQHAWRKAVRWVLNLPFNIHYFFLPLLALCLPIPDKIYRHSNRFIYSSLYSSNKLVAAVAQHLIHYARHNSLLGSNSLLICHRCDSSVDDFESQQINVSNDRFIRHCNSSVNNIWYELLCFYMNC